MCIILKHHWIFFTLLLIYNQKSRSITVTLYLSCTLESTLNRTKRHTELHRKTIFSLCRPQKHRIQLETGQLNEALDVWFMNKENSLIHCHNSTELAFEIV